MTSQLNAALEAIDFQRSELLLKELSLQIAALQGTADHTVRTSILKKMEKIAFEKTGIRFRLHLLKDRDPNAFIITADSSSANPMRPEAIKERLRRSTASMPTEKEFFKGMVNLQTGKVSGIYSEIPLDVFFSISWLDRTPKGNMFAPEEVAAVLIHEFGHGWMYLYMLGRSTVSNLSIAEIAGAVAGGADPKTIQDIIKVVEIKTGYRLKDLGTVEANPSPMMVQQVVMAQHIERIRSDLGTRFYDARVFEFAADQFAARHGAGSWIVKGLDRAYREFGHRPAEYMSHYAQLIMSLTTHGKKIVEWYKEIATGGAVLGAIVAGGTAVGTVATATVALAGVVMIGRIAVLTAFTALAGGDTYDKIPERFAAMRRELIASTKSADLSPDQRKIIADQIEEIDDVLSTLKKDIGPGALDALMAGFFSGKTKELKYMRLLEDLGNNRFFELSNKLQAQV